MEYSGPGRPSLMKSRAARSPCHLLRNSLFSPFTVGCQNATGDFPPALPDKPQREPRSLSSADTGAIVTRRFLFFLLAFLILTCTAYARLFNRALKPSASGIQPKTCVWTSPSGTPAVPHPFRSITETGASPAARGRPPVEGKHPLILLSHDSAGSRFSLHELASDSPATALSSWPSRIPATMWTTWEPFSCPYR